MDLKLYLKERCALVDDAHEIATSAGSVVNGFVFQFRMFCRGGMIAAFVCQSFV